MLNATKYEQAPEAVRRRILARYEVTENGCWLWTGSRTHDGYGQTAYRLDGRQFSIYPHVLAYLVRNGPLIEGMQIDHGCHDPATCIEPCQHRRCVNPAHLVQMPGRENLRRSGCPTGVNMAKTHCPQGHPYDAAEAGGRRCSRCRRADKARQYERHGQEQNARRQHRMRTDPEYRERRLSAQRATSRARYRERYDNDPDFRSKRRAEALARYHRKKAAQPGG